MKKVVMSIVLILAVFLAGCLDYKAYDLPEEPAGEVDLLDEIAAIEDELGVEEEAEEEMEEEMEDVEEDVEEVEEVAEEVVLPELAEEDAEPVASNNIPVITVDENELVNLNVRTSDADGDSVSYSFSSPLDSNGRWQTNYGDAGEYLIKITATDGKLTTEQDVKIMVGRVNVAPEVSGIRDISVREGEVVRFKPRITDPNGDRVDVSISEPLSKGIFKTDHTSSGEYRITVVASDGEMETEESFTLSIADVNELPQISNLEDLTVKEGELVELRPLVSDLDQDQITLTISDPVGNDGVWDTGYTDHGTYQITVVADDGKDSVTQTVNLVVEDVNVAPEIVDVFLDTN